MTAAGRTGAVSIGAAGAPGAARGSSSGSAVAGGDGGWSANVDEASVAEFLKSAKSAVLLTHAKPDGDAIGSTAALARCLKHIGIPAKVCYIGPLSRWVGGLIAGLEVIVLEPARELAEAGGGPGSARPWLGEPEVVAVCDTGSWSQLAEVKPWLVTRAATTVVIDHHVHGDVETAERRLVRTTAASATQVLAPICRGLLGVARDSQLPRDVAEMLYLGLATDTGWFRYSSVTPAAYRLAGDLLETGVDHTRLYRLIEQQDMPGRWRLLGRALSSLRLIPITPEHGGGDLAIMRLTLKDFAETGGDVNETGGFADMVLSIASVRAAAVLVEQETPSGSSPVTKVSVRSKPGPDAIDVNAAMRKLGGGGHVRAAGAKVKAGVNEADALVVGAMG